MPVYEPGIAICTHCEHSPRAHRQDASCRDGFFPALVAIAIDAWHPPSGRQVIAARVGFLLACLMLAAFIASGLWVVGNATLDLLTQAPPSMIPQGASS